MDIRIVGAHQTETSSGHATTFLIDERIALDAGNLAGALSLEGQRSLAAVLLTHYHYDHIRDFPSVAFSRWGNETLPTYCLPVVRERLRESFFNGVVWPRLDAIPSEELPAIRFCDLEPYAGFDVAGYRVLPAPANHSAPAVGFRIERNGRSVFYTGDTHGGEPGLWRRVQADLVLIEVSLPNRLDHVAVDAKHLTPNRLVLEIEAYRRANGSLPTFAAIHRGSDYEEEIVAELRQVSDEIGVSIEIPHDGHVFSL
jgi:ribonuclease BN (tRNA processing enzyme)